MKLGTYLIECHTQPRPVITFTEDPSEARRFQQAFTDHGTATVSLLTEYGENGFEKHTLTPEVLESHIKIRGLQQATRDLEGVMKRVEEKLAGQDFAALLLWHTGQTFDFLQGNWSLRHTSQGLHVEYLSRCAPFSITVTGPDGRMPWTEEDFWVCLNLPGHAYHGFWCVKGQWEKAPEVKFKGEGETLVNS